MEDVLEAGRAVFFYWEGIGAALRGQLLGQICLNHWKKNILKYRLAFAFGSMVTGCALP